MGKKKIVIALVLVAIILAGSIAAGTALEISQPVSASLTIEGIGNSPTLNILDNPALDTAGGTSGRISGDDKYIVDFGNLISGRAQTIIVGNADDPIFYIENNYAADMCFDAVKTGGNLGKGVRIEIWNNVSIFGIPEYPEDELVITLNGAENPEDWVVTMEPERCIPVGFPALGLYAKIVNEDAASSPSEGWDPKIKLLARSE
jgi:hypothetical protein